MAKVRYPALAHSTSTFFGSTSLPKPGILKWPRLSEMMVTASPSTPPTTVAVTIARGMALPLESRTQPKNGTPVSLLAPQLSDSSLKKSPPLANAGSEIKALTANPKAATLPIPIHDFIFISASSDRKQGLHASRMRTYEPGDGVYRNSRPSTNPETLRRQ